MTASTRRRYVGLLAQWHEAIASPLRGDRGEETALAEAMSRLVVTPLDEAEAREMQKIPYARLIQGKPEDIP